MVSEDVKERVVSYLAHQGTKDAAELAGPVERERERLLGLVDGLSDAQASWKPAPDEWCVKDLLRHVLDAERGVVRIVNTLAKGESLPAGDNRILGNQDPDESATLPQLLERLAGERKKLAAFVASLAPDTNLTEKYEHPFFGPLNCKEWVAFQRIHDGDHAGQIEKIKASPGFPAA